MYSAKSTEERRRGANKYFAVRVPELFRLPDLRHEEPLGVVVHRPEARASRNSWVAVQHGRTPLQRQVYLQEFSLRVPAEEPGHHALVLLRLQSARRIHQDASRFQAAPAGLQ